MTKPGRATDFKALPDSPDFREHLEGLVEPVLGSKLQGNPGDTKELKEILDSPEFQQYMALTSFSHTLLLAILGG